jgi:hypothetical protein
MKYAQDNVMRILANGQIPSNELLVAAGLSKEDAKKMIEEAQATGGTDGTNGSNGSKTSKYYTDESGNYYKTEGYSSPTKVKADDVPDDVNIDSVYEVGGGRLMTNKNGTRLGKKK